MTNQTFYILCFIWLIFSSIQTFIFYDEWINKKNKKQKIKNQLLDTKTFCVYNNMAYWKEDEYTYRAFYNKGSIDIKTIEKVSPLEIKDISIGEVMEIMNGLERASR
jgi:capsule polysaccharide export protein KpsE/RkpR